MSLKKFVLLLLVTFPFYSEAQLPELDEAAVSEKIQEIMHAHVSHKELNSTIVKRAMLNFLEIMDSNKAYFLKSEVQVWTEPDEQLIQETLEAMNRQDFSHFELMHESMIRAIHRRGEVEDRIAGMELPQDVDVKEFKDMDWVETITELEQRLLRLRAVREEALLKLETDKQDLARQRMNKRRDSYEEDFLQGSLEDKQRFFLSNVLKAVASALDSHTAYFTPGEATQFMISVQQRLFGIGAQLRDDITGFSVMKIIEGGPASQNKELKVKDRIIAVNQEPVVGLDIMDVVEQIRGEGGTEVVLTVVREELDEEENLQQKTLDITIIRGEVVLKETRIESDYEPFADGVIAYVRLYSFYQDSHSSSAGDLALEIEKLKRDHKVKGLVLDLRFNSGGLLAQAVSVTGLFISKGIVVSIKDGDGKLQHLRDTDGKVFWDGPLIVLTNKASASAAEIVAQTLQDYGRAVVVGDASTYGKGSFQTFTLNSMRRGGVNPQGEYKVTRGCYYTVSGKSPQGQGVSSDIVVPGALSQLEIGEEFSKFPLINESISPNFEDDLGDIPESQRERIARLYRFDLEAPTQTYQKHRERLRLNSARRIEKNPAYQHLLKLAKEEELNAEEELPLEVSRNDLQLMETFNVMKDFIILHGTSQNIEIVKSTQN